MNNNMTLLKISDFAEFCSVTKNTLFHYEKMGLLKPELTTENGYRYYTINQYFTLNIIFVLKSAGLPLKEIKRYIDNFDNDSFIAILSERHKKLEKEYAHIKHMKELLKNTIKTTEQINDDINIEPIVEEHEEQYLLTIAISKEDSIKEQMDMIGKHHKYCLSKGFTKSLISGFIKTKETIDSGDFSFDDYFFCETNHTTKTKKLYIKPKGKYAVLYHQGGYDTIEQAYYTLLDFISNENLTVIGNAYNYEMFGYLSSKEQKKFIIKIAIEVA